MDLRPVNGRTLLVIVLPQVAERAPHVLKGTAHWDGSALAVAAAEADAPPFVVPSEALHTLRALPAELSSLFAPGDPEAELFRDVEYVIAVHTPELPAGAHPADEIVLGALAEPRRSGERMPHDRAAG